MDFPGGSDGKEFACNARDPGLTPVSERSLGEGTYKIYENKYQTQKKDTLNRNHYRGSPDIGLTSQSL